MMFGVFRCSVLPQDVGQHEHEHARVGDLLQRMSPKVVRHQRLRLCRCSNCPSDAMLCLKSFDQTTRFVAAGGSAGLSTSTTAHDINQHRSSPRSSASPAKGSDVSSSRARVVSSSTSASASLKQLSQRPNSTVFRAPQLDFEHPDNCPRCGKVVYFVEEVKAMKRKWHKLCFKCGKHSISFECVTSIT